MHLFFKQPVEFLLLLKEEMKTKNKQRNGRAKFILHMELRSLEEVTEKDASKSTERHGQCPSHILYNVCKIIKYMPTSIGIPDTEVNG